MSAKVVTIEIDGNRTAMLAKEKTFSTGSRGFSVSDKIVIDGKRYQVGLNIVEIGSKPK